MTVKVKGIPVELGGQIYIIPPIALGPLEQLQDRLAVFDGTINKENCATVIDATHAALLRNYPDLTREQVGEMVGLENMQELMEAVMDVSGLKRKLLEETPQGEALPG